MLQLNRAKFSTNGNCGYVLKPQCMCQGEARGAGRAGPAGVHPRRSPPGCQRSGCGEGPPLCQGSAGVNWGAPPHAWPPTRFRSRTHVRRLPTGLGPRRPAARAPELPGPFPDPSVFALKTAGSLVWSSPRFNLNPPPTPPAAPCWGAQHPSPHRGSVPRGARTGCVLAQAGLRGGQHADPWCPRAGTLPPVPPPQSGAPVQ